MKWNLLAKKTEETKPKKTKLREWVDAAVFAVVAATLIRGLLFSAYAIPSGSMEGTQFAGDYLFVSKCSYGARMPFTPLSIPFTEPKVFGINTYLSALQLPYFRLPGFSDIKKGDIVVFNKPEEADQGVPIDERTALIKRCQAVAGDTLMIRNTQVFINGKAMPNAPAAQTSYDVVTDGSSLNPQLFDDLHIEVLGQTPANHYEMIIPVASLPSFKALSNIKSITPLILPAGQYDPGVFPHNQKFAWNMDQFGPIVLPKKGTTIPLNDSTITLYRRAIEVYEHHQLLANEKSYTFKMNYYWMMGDNRHNSLDSRFWGYVPEDHIVGKALLTFMSTDSTKDLFHKIRWNRVLKPLY